MPKVSVAFFSVAVLCCFVGMVWTAVMGGRGDFTLATVRDHLNVLGMLMGLFGAFYALAGDRRPRRLPWIHFLFSTVGVAAMIPAEFILKRAFPVREVAPTVAISLGTLVAVVGMLCFVVTVFSFWAPARERI